MKKLICMLLAMMLACCAASAEANTYEATAQGFGGDVTVTLTIEDGKLTDVVAVGDSETEGVGSNAIELMPGRMVAANSIDVDGVSGATFTSTAILTAAQEALAASGVTLTAVEPVAIEQHMTPGTYYGEAYGKWKKGDSEGARFGSPTEITPTRVAVTVDETSIQIGRAHV